MRGTFLKVVATAWALTAGVAKAGLYDPAQLAREAQEFPSQGKSLPFSSFRDQLNELFTIGIPQPVSPARARHLERAKELAARLGSGEPRVEDLVSLGAEYVRLGRTGEAVDVLTRASALDRRNFMVFANLGTAHQLEGRWARAIDALQQAKENWPPELPGLTSEQLKWFRRAEDYHLKLVRLRARETLSRPTNAAAAAEGLDDLFGVRFASQAGEFQAGRMPAEEQKKLPPDAVAIVQQLLLWFPADARLYWQLGELLNAKGDIASAATVFDECVWSRRYDPPLLRAHRQVVQQANAAQAPVLGALEPSAPEPPAGWRLDRRLIATGAVAGVLLVGVLAYLQLREFRKRRIHGSGVRDQGSGTRDQGSGVRGQ
jgi:tetratricopeptide (TPR) repeat protein